MKKNNYQLLEHTKIKVLDENRVLTEFAKRLNVTPMQIIEKNRIRHMCDIRHLYCKLRYEMHGATYSEVAHEIDRSHVTVRYAVMRINNMLEVNNSKIVAMWNGVKDIAGYFFVETRNKGLETGD